MSFPVLYDGPRRKRRLTFLLRDDFTTTEAAPLASPRTCEPGPGTLTIVDSANRLSISGTRLRFNGGQGSNDPLAMSPTAYDHTAGRAYFAHLDSSALNTNSFRIGFGNNPLTRPTQAGWFQGGAAGWSIVVGAASPDLRFTPSINTQYWLAVILRSAGVWFLARGGAITEWTLMWIDVAHTLSTLYVGAAVATSHASITQIDTERLIDLGSVWADDYGIATERHAGVVSVGQAFTHEANCLIEWTQTTVPSALQTSVFFRQQDASNYWQVDVTSAGTLGLYEVVAGVPTLRGTAVGVVSSGHRIVIIADGTTIQGYSNDTLRWTYAAGVNFQTETDGELNTLGTGGAVSDLITWPRILSGGALTSLEAVRNA